MASLWKYSSISQPVALYKDEWSMSHPSCFTWHPFDNRLNGPQGSFSHGSWKKVYASSWESNSATSLVTRETEPSTQWHNTYWYQIRWCSNNTVMITLHYTQIYKKKICDYLMIISSNTYYLVATVLQQKMHSIST